MRENYANLLQSMTDYLLDFLIELNGLSETVVQLLHAGFTREELECLEFQLSEEDWEDALSRAREEGC